jgi:hypothetical protein
MHISLSYVVMLTRCFRLFVDRRGPRQHPHLGQVLHRRHRPRAVGPPYPGQPQVRGRSQHALSRRHRLHLPHPERRQPEQEGWAIGIGRLVSIFLLFISLPFGTFPIRSPVSREL